MTFDFFNTSNLAFGKKLTQAFQTLNDLADNSEMAVDNAIQNLEYYKQYGELNYQAPVPVNLTSPARVNEIFAVIDGYKVFKQLQYQNELLSVEYIYFTQQNSKITLASGSTTLKEGYAFITPSISNSNIQRAIRFSEENDPKGAEELLFQFRIDNNGKINFSGDLQSSIGFYSYDATQYRELVKGDAITLPYTATDYECICVVGTDLNIEISKDGTTSLSGRAKSNVDGEYDYNTYTIVYLKPKQRLTGVYSKAFKVNYSY